MEARARSATLQRGTPAIPDRTRRPAGRLTVPRPGATERAEPLARSAGKRRKAVDHGATEAREAVRVQGRELRGEIVNNEQRSGLRARLGTMV